MSHFSPQTLVYFAAGFTVAVPYVSAILTQKHYPRWLNELIAFFVSTGAGVVSFWQAGGNFHNVKDLSNLLPLVPAIFAGAKLYYVKLGYSSPLIAWIEWLTGGLQKGFPPPSFAASPSPLSSDSQVDPLPTHATDSGSGETFFSAPIAAAPIVSTTDTFATPAMPASNPVSLPTTSAPTTVEAIDDDVEASDAEPIPSAAPVIAVQPTITEQPTQPIFFNPPTDAQSTANVPSITTEPPVSAQASEVISHV